MTVMDDPVAKVLSRLDAKSTDPGTWEARCPAHEDKHASLSVKRREDGGVLLHCHAGCTYFEIMAAAGLQPGDGFPPKARKPTAKIVAEYDYRD